MSDDFDDLLLVLDEIRRIVQAGRPAFDAEVRQRWALERAWIFVGNLAERISRRTSDADIWTELVGIRNVYSHYTPRTIDYDRVWFDASTDIDRVIAEVCRRQSGLEQ